MKILVLDNYESFSLAQYLAQRLDESCRLYKMGNVYDEHMWGVLKRLEPDVVLVEFCDRNAQVLTSRISELAKRPKVIVRMHGYEAQDWYIKRVDWSAVDDLIVVSPVLKELADRKLSSKVRISLVENGVDLERFSLQPLDAMGRWDVAYLGYLNKKKGPALLRTVMASTPRAMFHVGGVVQDEQTELYMLSLNLPNVRYTGWVRPEQFFRGKRFVISTSVTESFGMSIGEGMACGLTPLVHAWPGAERLWPEAQVWSTFQELERFLLEPLPPEECRRWVADRYPITATVDKVLGLIMSR